jgi:hypothetical protein
MLSGACEVNYEFLMHTIYLKYPPMVNYKDLGVDGENYFFVLRRENGAFSSSV